MEEDQNQLKQESQVEEKDAASVSFPTVGQPQKSGGAKTLLVVGILVLVGILGFVIYKSATNKNGALAEPTPFENQIIGENTVATPTSTPTSTTKPADKSKVSIQIQNGTGITGEAAYLQTQLKDLGYTNVKVGNAGDQVATSTTVTFSKSLSQDVVTELTQKLNALYQSVTVKTTATLSDFDVVVVTGLRKGASPKPSVTPKSASPTASPSATPAI